MKRTNTLDEKIKKYATVAVGVAGVSGASAQVVYTDVNPDQVLTPGGTAQFAIDFNGDAAADIAFLVYEGTFSGTFATQGYNIPYNGDYAGGIAGFGTAAPSQNGWMGTNSDAPLALANGAAIGSAGAFYGGNGTVGNVQGTYLGAPINAAYGPYSDGYFLGAEGYLGVRFDVAGAVHYGWVRVEMAADGTSMTIKDYAYNATASTNINAGDMGGTPVGINDISNNVIIRNQYNKLNIELVNINNAEISVVNLAGQVVINDQMTTNVKEINMSDLTTGIYMVNVTSEAGSTTKKIYVK